MIIERRSALTGRAHEMDLDITEDQLRIWRMGALIQDAMPNLTPAEREFVKTGITPEEWEEYFPQEDEDEG